MTGWRGWMAESIFLSRVHCGILWHIYNNKTEMLLPVYYTKMIINKMDNLFLIWMYEVVSYQAWPNKEGLSGNETHLFRLSVKIGLWPSRFASGFQTYLEECKCFLRKFSLNRRWLVGLHLLQSILSQDNWPFDQLAYRSIDPPSAEWPLESSRDCHFALNWHACLKYRSDRCPRRYLK